MSALSAIFTCTLVFVFSVFLVLVFFSESLYIHNKTVINDEERTTKDNNKQIGILGSVALLVCNVM
jgi:hypothetical protein